MARAELRIDLRGATVVAAPAAAQDPRQRPVDPWWSPLETLTPVEVSALAQRPAAKVERIRRVYAAG